MTETVISYTDSTDLKRAEVVEYVNVSSANLALPYVVTVPFRARPLIYEFQSKVTYSVHTKNKKQKNEEKKLSNKIFAQ